jgi:hypothetical protein
MGNGKNICPFFPPFFFASWRESSLEFFSRKDAKTQGVKKELKNQGWEGLQNRTIFAIPFFLNPTI